MPKAKQQSEDFGRLLKGGVQAIAMREDKSAGQIDEELSDLLSISVGLFHSYKGGTLPLYPAHIETIARNVVQRSFLDDRWARDFLRSTNYHGTEYLLADLFQQTTAVSPTHRRTGNLPPARYSHFVMRSRAFTDLNIGIRQSLPVVIVHGFGGMGKSSLVAEFARTCTEGRDEASLFDVPVWVSDQGREGTTNLTTVLETVAKELDYEYGNVSWEEKKYRCRRLLSEHHVLLVIDNYETIKDQELISWLFDNLPHSSKAIVTSRENLPPFLDNAWPVDLNGMTPEEADELIRHRLIFLHREELLKTEAERLQLIRVTGANPCAIVMALGDMKYARQPQDVISDLELSRGKTHDELFNRLLRRSWDHLNLEGRQIALAMKISPQSVSAAALSWTAGVSGVKDDGVLLPHSPFDDCIRRLVELKILDEDQTHGTCRYSQLSLVRTLMPKVYDEQTTSFLEQARGRALEWYAELSRKIGYCWYDLPRLRIMDADGEKENVSALLTWAADNGYDQRVVQIARDLRYYHYVRGNWSNDTSLNLRWAEAAKRLNDLPGEFDALVYHINVASKRCDLQEVEKHLPRVEELAQSILITEPQRADMRHAKALYLLARGDYLTAASLWNANLNNSQILDPQFINANLRALGSCLLAMGELEKAKSTFEKVLQDSRDRAFKRGELAAKVKLIAIAVEQDEYNKAAGILSDIVEKVVGLNDRMLQAEAYSLDARVREQNKDVNGARVALAKAADLYERLGYDQKRDEMRATLQRLSSDNGITKRRPSPAQVPVENTPTCFDLSDMS